jgi:hypothetical protein
MNPQARFDRTRIRFKSKVLLGMVSCDVCPTSRKRLLRIDDLPIPAAAMPDEPYTSLCRNERELLPFVP